MARVLVATQSWGVLWERESDRSLKVPAAGVLAVLDTTVYAASSGGTVIAPSAFVTNADGELPGYVDEGAWSLTVGVESFPVAALGGTLPARTASLEGSQATQDTAITANAAAITTETTARGTADTALSTAIGSEATARATAVSSEATTRSTADATNAAAISTEVTDRTNADNTLRGQAVAFAVALGG